MIFVFEPIGGYGTAIQPGADRAGYTANVPAAPITLSGVASSGTAGQAGPAGLMTMTLTQGANVLPYAQAQATMTPTTESVVAAASLATTGTPSMSVASQSSSSPTPSPQMTSKPPSLSAGAGGTLSATPSGAYGDRVVHNPPTDDNTTSFNKATLIIVLVLFLLLGLVVSIWYLRKRRAQIALREGMDDLENSAQEKRLSRLLAGGEQRTWMKLDEPESPVVLSEKQAQGYTATPPSSRIHEVDVGPRGGYQYPEREEQAYRPSSLVYGHSYASATVAPAHDESQRMGQANAEAYAQGQSPATLSQSHTYQPAPYEGCQVPSDLPKGNRLSRDLTLPTLSSSMRASTMSWFPPPPTSLPPLPLLPPPQHTSTSTPFDDAHHVVDNDHPGPGMAIGLATTTCMTVSSSRSAVAIDAYPLRGNVGSNRDLTALSRQGSGKRRSIPPASAQTLGISQPSETERTPTFLPLGGADSSPAGEGNTHSKVKEAQRQTLGIDSAGKRHPTESLYVIYKDRVSGVPR
ncbi:hypothetical protein IAU60_005132 [Kwoniella sp. DSM 27419]